MHVFLSITLLSFSLATTLLLPTQVTSNQVNINNEKALCNSIYKAALHSDEKTLGDYIRVIRARGYTCSNFNKLPDSKGDDSSLLHLAARQGDTASVKLLIKHGFPLLLRNIYGDTFLHVALYNKHINLVKEVLHMLSYREFKESGLLAIHEDRIGDTVLHLACDKHLVNTNQNEEFVLLLLEKGASPRALNGESQTSRDVAILQGSINLIPILDEFIKKEMELEELTLGQADSETSAVPVLSLLVGVGTTSLVIYKLLEHVSKTRAFHQKEL